MTGAARPSHGGSPSGAAPGEHLYAPHVRSRGRNRVPPGLAATVRSALDARLLALERIDGRCRLRIRSLWRMPDRPTAAARGGVRMGSVRLSARVMSR